MCTKSTIIYHRNIMKHIKKPLKKISNNVIKKWSTILVLLFFGVVILFQKDTPNTTFQFVRNSDENDIHGVANDNAQANQRDYLFQNEAGNEVYQGQITDEHKQDQVSTSSTQENMDELISTGGKIQTTSSTKSQTGQIYTGSLSGKIYTTWTVQSWTIQTGVQAIQTTWIAIPNKTITWTADCITPWKELVKHKDFILAYQQRKDVNSMCNIEKRVCTNGILWWSFTQSSCKEDITYVYRKAEVVSYNQKVLNEYIQPAEPIHAGGEFNNEWKINTTDKPSNIRGTSNNSISTKSWTLQTPWVNKAYCTTPRGQKIQHGQFIKAYKSPRWFLDLACEVEIRPCINGSLKWTFTYSKCIFNNTSYIDYMNAWNTQASKKFLFFERIKWLR